MRRRDRPRARRSLDLRERWLLGRSGNPRRPVVAEPQGRQHVQLGRRRPPVDRGDLHQDVLRATLGVLHEDVEVAVVLEDARVEQLVLHLVAGAPPVRLHQVGVGIGRLGILVEVLHVGVGRRAVEVEVVLLDVLAVVPLAVGQAEEALLEDGVLAVPQGQGEAEPLLVVGEAGEPVLAPAVGPRARLIVREVVPGVAVFAIVLAHRSPLTLAQVGTPLSPGDPSLARLGQAPLLRRVDCCRHRIPPALGAPVPSGPTHHGSDCQVAGLSRRPLGPPTRGRPRRPAAGPSRSTRPS